MIYLVVVAPRPKPNDDAAVVVCAPYGGALVPNVNPLVVIVAVAGAPSSVGVAIVVGVPKPKPGAGA